MGLQKMSYTFINYLYTTYYKSIRLKEFLPYSYYFEMHNSDLFILIYLFIQYFYDNKIINKLKRVKNFNLGNFEDFYKLKILSIFDRTNNFKNLQNLKFKRFLRSYKLTKIQIKFFTKFLFDKLLLIDSKFLNMFKDFSFFDFILYICRKIKFQKYNHSFDFYIK